MLSTSCSSRAAIQEIMPNQRVSDRNGIFFVKSIKQFFSHSNLHPIRLLLSFTAFAGWMPSDGTAPPSVSGLRSWGQRSPTYHGPGSLGYIFRGCTECGRVSNRCFVHIPGCIAIVPILQTGFTHSTYADVKCRHSGVATGGARVAECHP